jgi:1-acyl-sn-glycerol-3-phosphate acyltransferase
VRTRFLPGSSDLEGGFVLACNHPSHLDPFIASLLVPRRIYWMARIEFYRTWWSSALMHSMGAFPVNRQGMALSSIKKAIALVNEKRVVGIFPEGEVRRDRSSVLRGGPIKRGVCLISQHTGRPVVPCIVLGTEALIWLRVYRMSKPCRLWVACGDPIYPPEAGSKRESRQIMAEQIERSMRALHRELRRDIADSWARKHQASLILNGGSDEHGNKQISRRVGAALDPDHR